MTSPLAEIDLSPELEKRDKNGKETRRLAASTDGW